MTAAVIQVDFAASQAAREARDVRKIVRKADLTRAERDILMVLVNLWFYHRTKGRDGMHPGKPSLARKAKVCEETVKRALRSFRASGIILPVAGSKGGGRTATTYVLDLIELRKVLDPHGVRIKAGELVNLPILGVQNVPPETSKMFPLRGGEMFPCIRTDKAHKKEPKPSETDFDGGDHA